jgi:hypothetical protein
MSEVIRGSWTNNRERLRWILKPGQREYIIDLLIGIREHIREGHRGYAMSGVLREQLTKLECNLVSLLPEVQFDADDQPRLQHPLGFDWQPEINRKPKALIYYVCQLEEIDYRYREIRWRHNFDVDLQERES